MNRLKELREDRDLLQKDIAEILKIDQSNYSKYELEKINIPIDTLKKLADYYNTSIDYLLYRTDNRHSYTKSIMKEEQFWKNSYVVLLSFFILILIIAKYKEKYANSVLKRFLKLFFMIYGFLLFLYYFYKYFYKIKKPFGFLFNDWF